jgi:hypothetical protein
VNDDPKATVAGSDPVKKRALSAPRLLSKSVVSSPLTGVSVVDKLMLYVPRVQVVAASVSGVKEGEAGNGQGRAKIGLVVHLLIDVAGGAPEWEAVVRTAGSAYQNRSVCRYRHQCRQE